MKKKDLGAGVLLIVMGAVFLLSNLGTIGPLDVGRLWPVVLIVMGAGHLLFPDDGSRLGGLPLLLIGGIFLAHNYDVLRIRDSWPLFIVAAGLSVLAGAYKSGPAGQDGGKS